jgi:nucleotide-binding universal stress UspA family protein
MFETIVWATDGSGLAESVLPQVRELARQHGSRIVAVHATELVGRFASAPMLPDEPETREHIARRVAELVADGFDASFEVVSGTGSVPELVAGKAKELGAGLVVVGTHGHGGIAAAVLGSVARGLCHTAHCPVLVVPPSRTSERPEPERETIHAA